MAQELELGLDTFGDVTWDADEAWRHLHDHDVDATPVDEQPWGRFVTFTDPDGNAWTLQELPPRDA